MTRQGTSILADEKLQGKSDPLDIFSTPEIEQNSQILHQNPNLPIKNDGIASTIVEISTYDGHYLDSSKIAVQYQLEFIHKTTNKPNTADDYVSVINNLAST